MEVGIISALNRDVEVDGEQMTLIQTSAALNSGNSGGALINAWGQVVGITNMKMMSDYDTIEGLGFAFPTTTTKTIVDTLIETGKVTGDAVLGITVKAAGSGEGGVVVYRVDRSSDAYHQGVRVDDVILRSCDAMNGTTLIRFVTEFSTTILCGGVGLRLSVRNER